MITVFILGLEEGIFPSELSRYSDEDLEEERRLCYGHYPAPRALSLVEPEPHDLWPDPRNRPSRFLEEIEPELVDQTESPAIARHSFGGFGSLGARGYSQGGHAFGLAVLAARRALRPGSGAAAAGARARGKALRRWRRAVRRAHVGAACGVHAGCRRLKAGIPAGR